MASATARHLAARPKEVPMGSTIFQSICECQTCLFAELDDQWRVVRGWAQSSDAAGLLRAPARAVAHEAPFVDVAWLCPVCDRNTLRCFDGRAAATQPRSISQRT